MVTVTCILSRLGLPTPSVKFSRIPALDYRARHHGTQLDLRGQVVLRPGRLQERFSAADIF